MAAAGERAVAGFAVEVLVAEDVGVVAGLSLGFVDGHGVGVVETTRVEIRRGDRLGGVVVERDADGATERIDSDDCAALTVEDPESVVVGEGHDPVTNRERTIVHDECVGPDRAFGL